MRSKYLWINLFREIAHTMTRFLSIFFISLIGVAFFAGVRASSPDMQVTADRYLDKTGLADLTVVSSAGISEDDLEALEAIEGVEAVVPLLSSDVMMHRETDGEVTDYNVHLISMPLPKQEKHAVKWSVRPDYGISGDDFVLNRPDLTEGRLPEDDHEIALDARLKNLAGLKRGGKVVLSANGVREELYICGFAESPKYISEFSRGHSSIGNGDSNGFAYVSGNTIGRLGSKLPLLSLFAVRYSEADIRVAGAEELNCFSDEYKALIKTVSDRIEAYGDTTDATWYVRNREDNPGYLDYSENTERIEAIGIYFPLIFLLVAMLVALTTMTRMVEDQRIEIGTLKALGYSQSSIVTQELMYAILASLTGSLIGTRFGFWIFPMVIVNSYGIMFRLPDFHVQYWPDLAALSIAMIVGSVTLAAAFVTFSALHEVPASLMRPKAPKPGKRVLLEHVGFIWNRLGFTTKVTIRNMFLYKKRFWMCVIGIAGSCGLLVTGFGLSDSIFGMIPAQFDRLWQVDFEAYTYDAMPREEIDTLVKKLDPESELYNVAYCYDKSVSGGSADEMTTDIHLFVTGDPEALSRQICFNDDDGNPIRLEDGGAVITKKIAENHNLRVGDRVSFKLGDDTYEADILGIAENYVYHYIYMTSGCYERVTGEETLFNCVYANVTGYKDADAEAKKAIEDEWNTRFLADSRVYLTTFLSGIHHDIYDTLSVLNYVVGILIIAAGALSFVVMLNLTNINITERRRELATLKVLGFTDKEMYDYVFRENNALAAIGTALGLVFGKYLHRFVVTTVEVDMVMFIRKADPSSYVYSAVLSLVFAMIVNLLMRRKVRRINMVESLKSAE